MRGQIARRRLEELLMQVHRCREEVKEQESRGGSVDTAKSALRIANALVRAHCEETGLDRPHDIPAEGGDE